MIRLSEQWGYNRTGYYNVTDEQALKLLALRQSSIKKTYRRKGEDVICLYLDIEEQGNSKRYHFETSYFIGVDWIIESEQAVFVEPKLNNEESEVDYLSMLFEALDDTENCKHLDELFDVKFESPTIRIHQKQDMLTPFLVIEYMQLLKQIVRKGLKKSYYRVIQNLESRAKGKVLVGQTIRHNISKGQVTRTYCQFEEFGIDSFENRILKEAFRVALQLLPLFKHKKTSVLKHIADYITPAFENVSNDVDFRYVEQFKPNPIYKEYERALNIALCLLKRKGYNQDNKSIDVVVTPPYWIDMSKLFELYVFKKLREIFPHHNEVEYHIKNNRQEIDFLINCPNKNIQMVIDTKYKPRYENQRVSTKDIRQVCGYARMKKIYEKLNIDYSRVIDCMIIYSHQNNPLSFDIDTFIQGNEESNYVNFYKIGIGLPCI